TIAGGRTAPRLRSLLLGTEVALCIVLLVCAGLLLRSFDQLMRVDRGFETANVVTFNAQLPIDRYTMPVQRLSVWRTLIERLSAIPGVTGVGASNRLPMAPENGINGVLAEGEAPASAFEQPMANYRTATSGYFQAAGIPLRTGRIFTDAAADSNAV